jgi:hypothetical protein
MRCTAHAWTDRFPTIFTLIFRRIYQLLRTRIEQFFGTSDSAYARALRSPKAPEPGSPEPAQGGVVLTRSGSAGTAVAEEVQGDTATIKSLVWAIMEHMLTKHPTLLIGRILDQVCLLVSSSS